MKISQFIFVTKWKFQENKYILSKSAFKTKTNTFQDFSDKNQNIQ